MNLHLYKCTDDKKNVTKTLDDALNYTVYLKEGTSIINPIFKIGGSPEQILGDTDTDEPAVNYAYCPRFDRYYYVTDIVILNAQLIEIHCHVDVLMSHLRKSIHKTPLFAKRWEGGTDAQKYVPEERLNLRTKTQLNIIEFGNDVIEPSEFFIMCTAGTGEPPDPSV